jgi:hypothetical protein
MLSPDLRQEPRSCHPLNIRGWVLDCFPQQSEATLDVHVGAARPATPKADCVHEVAVGEQIVCAVVEPPQLTHAGSIEAASGDIEDLLCKATHLVLAAARVDQLSKSVGPVLPDQAQAPMHIREHPEAGTLARGVLLCDLLRRQNMRLQVRDVRGQRRRNRITCRRHDEMNYVYYHTQLLYV